MRSRAFWAFLALLFGLTPRDATAAQTLRVLTFNTWGLPKPWLQKPIRFPLLQRTAPSLDADVLAFQETFANEAQVLARIEGYPYVALGPRGGVGRIDSGLLIASRWPIVQTARSAFRSCNGSDCLARKGALYARIDVPGVGEVDFFTTHLDSGGTDRDRDAQVRQLLGFIERHSGPRAIVLAGDFNFTSRSLAYRNLAQRMQDAHEEFRTANPGLPALDWDGFTYDPYRNENVKTYKYPAERIDYVWTRSDCAKIVVNRTRLALDETIDGHFLSDHFGVLADFSIDAGACGGP